MEFSNIGVASPYNSEHFVAEELIQGNHSNVRIIRLAPHQSLPPHKHGVSDLMLYSVEGIAVMTTPTGKKDFVAGDIVYIAADEELVVSNEGEEGVTLLAFLSPPFPPRE